MNKIKKLGSELCTDWVRCLLLNTIGGGGGDFSD